MTLVLTRWRNEKLMIGDDIVVKVLSIKGDTVKLGITAPADSKISMIDAPNEKYERKT